MTTLCCDTGPEQTQKPLHLCVDATLSKYSATRQLLTVTGFFMFGIFHPLSMDMWREHNFLFLTGESKQRRGICSTRLYAANSCHSKLSSKIEVLHYHRLMTNDVQREPVIPRHKWSSTWNASAALMKRRIDECELVIVLDGALEWVTLKAVAGQRVSSFCSSEDKCPQESFCARKAYSTLQFVFDALPELLLVKINFYYWPVPI